MRGTRPYVLVTLKWLTTDPQMKFPEGRAFPGTGYREADGIAGLFSVYVVLLEGTPGPNVEQQGRLFALAESMEERLPQPGERFILTAGLKPVAEALATARGRASPLQTTG